ASGGARGALWRGEQRAEFLSDFTDTAVRGGRAYWESEDPAKASAFAGRWAKASSDAIGIDLATYLTPSAVASSLRQQLLSNPAWKPPASASDAKVHGVDALR